MILELAIGAVGLLVGWIAREQKARVDTKLLKAAEAVASVVDEDDWADGMVVPTHTHRCERVDGAWRCAPACDYRKLRMAVAMSKRDFTWTKVSDAAPPQTPKPRKRDGR